MDATQLAVRFTIDGCVAIPGVLQGTELEGVRAAYEAVTHRAGTRWVSWDDIKQVPELVPCLFHPRITAVIDEFMAIIGEEAVFSNANGARDAFDPVQTEFTPGDYRHGNLGWHEDAMGMRSPDHEVLQHVVAVLLYLDDTFDDSGAYCSAVGSHHLTRVDETRPYQRIDATLVLDHCELVPLAVKAGTAIIHRGLHWHGVVPPKQMRRLLTFGYGARSTYPRQVGHTQLEPATTALVPAEQHKYFCWY